MQHDTTTCNMIQQHTTRWSNGTNFFFTTNVARCCMKSWDRLTGALNVNYSYDIDTELNFQHPVFIEIKLW